jgi:hypothetical protein
LACQTWGGLKLLSSPAVSTQTGIRQAFVVFVDLLMVHKLLGNFRELGEGFRDFSLACLKNCTLLDRHGFVHCGIFTQSESGLSMVFLYVSDCLAFVSC